MWIKQLVSNLGLKKFLKKNAEGDTLAVLDSKLGSIIKEKLDIPCIYRYLVCKQHSNSFLPEASLVCG